MEGEKIRNGKGGTNKKGGMRRERERSEGKQ